MPELIVLGNRQSWIKMQPPSRAKTQHAQQMEDVMSKPAREFFSPQALPPPVGYSQIAKINKGALVYIAGQVGWNARQEIADESSDRLGLQDPGPCRMRRVAQQISPWRLLLGTDRS